MNHIIVEKYRGGVKSQNKNLAKIRLLSFNEAILKLLVPYGNKQNLHSTYSYPLPWQISEGKYGINHYLTQQLVSDSRVYQNILLNKLDSNKFNNLYEYSYNSSNVIGLLGQNQNWNYFPTKGNGYALCYQDNYEDKPEIRVKANYYLYLSRYKNTFTQSYYSKNGDAVNVGGAVYRLYHAGGSLPGWDNYNETPAYQVGTTINYKTSTMQYQGMWPVINIAN